MPGAYRSTAVFGESSTQDDARHAVARRSAWNAPLTILLVTEMTYHRSRRQYTPVQSIS
jgi:hypothetical protein